MLVILKVPFINAIYLAPIVIPSWPLTAVFVSLLVMSF